MEVREASTTIMASVQEQAAVAELMEPSESLVGRPSLDITMGGDGEDDPPLVLLSPPEPTDDPEDS